MYTSNSNVLDSFEIFTHLIVMYTTYSNFLDKFETVHLSNIGAEMIYNCNVYTV